MAIINNKDTQNDLSADVYYRYNMYNKFLIKEEDFSKLLNLYKFKLDYRNKGIIDNKRREYVGQATKNLLDESKYDIFFSSDWIYTESCANSNKIVVNILKTYPQLKDWYKKYQERMEKDKKRFEAYCVRWSLDNKCTKLSSIETEEDYLGDYLDD